MNSKNYVVKFISWIISIVFVLSVFLPKLEAKELKDYDIHTYKSRQCGATFTYKKNNDGENTITLLSIVSVSNAEGIKITSPIDSYEVTRVADNFSSRSGKSKVWNPFFRTLSANTKIFFRNLGRGLQEASIALIPFGNIFYFAARDRIHNSLGYESYELYKKEINNSDRITEIDLPQCLQIGNRAFCCPKLKKVNIPKCERIGDQAFLYFDALDEMCISKDIDLHSHWIITTLQGILDCGNILKYIDENSKEVRVHSLGEFPNFNKYQKAAH